MRKSLRRIESLESRLLLASDWQNPIRIRDVNSDNFVTPLDALIGINRLNTQASASLPETRGDSQPYFDVNGDSSHTPLDVLLIINALNSGPLLDVRLANDTGAGTGADSDRLTYDFALRGSIDGGAADEVLGKLDGQNAWVDLTTFVNANRLLAISSAQLEQSFGMQLADGSHSLLVSARRASDRPEIADRVQLNFVVDRTSPATHVVTDILMSRPDAIEIPLDEPLSPASLAASGVYLWDITWGEKPTGSAWTQMDSPRFDLTPQSVTLSVDSRKLIIQPPTSTRSIKYLIELDRSAEDLAGNPLPASTQASPQIFRANYFAPSVNSISFDTTVQTPVTIAPTINEYAFSLSRADRLIWSGNLALGSYAQAQLFNAQGELIKTWLSDPTVTFPVPDTSDVISLAAGQYRLRIVAAPASNIQFRIYLESQLPFLPGSRATGNSDAWPLDAFRMPLSAGERVLFQANETGQTLPVRAVLGPQGKHITIELLDNGAQILNVKETLPAIILMHRVGYQVHRSSLVTRTLATDTWIEGDFSTPGQRIEFTFTGTPGDLLAVETNDPLGNVRYEFGAGGVAQSTSPLILALDGAPGRLTVTNAGPSSSNLGYRFRVHSLATAPLLTLGAAIPAPPAGQVRYYWIDQRADSQILKLSGNVETKLFSYQRELPRLMTLPDQPVNPLPPGLYYLMVRSSLTTPPNAWQADLIDVTPQRQPLPDGDVVISFPTGFEEYEFTLGASAGQILRFEQLQTRSSLPRLTLRDPNGHAFETFDYQAPLGWLVPYSGQYVLVIHDSPTAGEDLVFRFHSQLSGPTLPKDQSVVVPVPPAQRIAAKFTATREPFLVQFTNVPGNLGSWQILTQDQRAVAQGVASNTADIEERLTDGADYWLILTSLGTAGAFEFIWRATTLTQTTIQLGQTVTGSLGGYRDRALFEITLEKGQAVRADEWTLSPGIAARWLDLPNETGAADRFWQAPQAGTYRLELLNTKSTTGDYELRLSDLSLNYSPVGLNGFQVRYSGNATSDAPAEYPVFITQNTAFTIDILSDFTHSLGLKIVGPTDKVVFEGRWFDSPMLIAETSGTYRVMVTSAAIDIAPDQYAFQCLTPSLAEIVELNTQVTVPLEPHQTKLFRVAVPNHALTYLGNTDAVGLVSSPLSPNVPLVQPLGDYVVLSASERDGYSSSVDFNWRGLDAATALNSRVQIDSARTTVVAVGVAAGQRLTVTYPGNNFAQVIAVLDEHLESVPVVEGSWVPTTAGLAYFVIYVPESPGSPPQIDVAITTPHITLSSIELGKVWQTVLPLTQDIAIASVNLTTDQAVVLMWSGSIRATLITPSGNRILITESFWRIPITENGVYKIECAAFNDRSDLSLLLIDLDAQPVLVEGGSISDTLSTEKPFGTFRFAGTPGHRVRFGFTQGEANTQIIDRWGHRYAPEMEVPNDGSVWVILSGVTSYTMSATRLTVETILADMGQWYEGTLPAIGNTTIYRFQTTRSGRAQIELIGADQYVSLTDSYGRPLQVDFSQAPRVLVDSHSTYQLIFNGTSPQSAYRWRVSYHEPQAAEPLNAVSVTYQLDELFTVDLADDGRDHWTINVPIAIGQLLAWGSLTQHEQSLVQYRLLGVGENDNSAEQWRPIGQFPEQLAVLNSGRLQLQITGRGSNRFRIVDLHSAASLVLDGQQSLTVSPSDRLLAWTIPVSKDRDIIFTSLLAPTGSQWFIVDSFGRQLKSVSSGDRVSIVSPKRMTLVLKLVEPLTGPEVTITTAKG